MTQTVAVRWGRTLGLALPLIVLNTGWIANSEMRTKVTEITITTLFIGVAFLLFLLSVGNALVRRFLPKTALRPAELFAVYVMLSLSSSVAGIGNLGFFTPFLTNAWRYGPERGWEKFFSYLPTNLLGPRDPARLKDFYEGHTSFFTREALLAWGPSLAFWGVFLFLLFSTLLCLAYALRQRWADQEHLTFPVVALPLELCREGVPLFRNTLFWAGFVLPAFFYTLNTLAGMYPSLPSLPFNKPIDLMALNAPPFSGFGMVVALIHPSGIGFGFLINADMLLSLWVFHVAKKLLNFWGVTQNWRDLGTDTQNEHPDQFPFIQFQAWGAWLVVCVAALFAARRYFATLPQQPGARVALTGAAIGFLAIWAMLVLAGAPWWLPLVLLTIYILLQLTLTRLIAETAVLSPLLNWVDPQSMITTLAGTAALSPTDLSYLATLSWFNLDYRAAVMPQALQGFVGMRRSHSPLRPFAFACLLALAVAIVSALLWDMQFYHVNGAATANVNNYRPNMASSPWAQLNGWWARNRAPDSHAWLGALFGAATTLLLGILRTRFVGFPLTPSAYVLNLTWANELFWLDLLIAWVLKASVLRYGGIKLYRTALPFFLGLILGDFVTGAFWSLVGLGLGAEIYRTFPN
ncbi:DUF6785 family protein [Armatimonas sp.]|uniref:DUF6785 family protein n=1 Tax=Armatimonas sp. TaxID=1872638 RepID=UPI0037525157